MRGWYWWVLRKHKLASIFFSEYMNHLTRPIRLLLFLFDLSLHFLLTLGFVYQTLLNPHVQSALVVMICGIVIQSWKLLAQYMDQNLRNKTLFYASRVYHQEVFLKKVYALERKRIIQMSCLLIVPLITMLLVLVLFLMLFLRMQERNKELALITLKSLAKNWGISQGTEFAVLLIIYWILTRFFQHLELNDQPINHQEEAHRELELNHKKRVLQGRKKIDQVLVIKRTKWRKNWQKMAQDRSREK